MHKYFAAAAGLFVSVLFLFPGAADAQRRDYLTESEVELVREAQEIDLRILVLSKAVERRIAVARGEKPKEKEEWGELPAGTRLELFTDIQELLSKAISDIDNVAGRSRDSKLFPKAVVKLADSCESFVPKFKAFLDEAKDGPERAPLYRSLESCGAIVEASAKIPRESVKKN